MMALPLLLLELTANRAFGGTGLQGRGLGFMFLRHLRRTRVLMHVVDAADVDPVTDYWTVSAFLLPFTPASCMMRSVSQPNVTRIHSGFDSL